MGINHPVSDRVKLSFVIFDIRALWRSGLRSGLSVRRQSAQMSKNYKWRFNPDTGCFIGPYSCTHMATVGVKFTGLTCEYNTPHNLCNLTALKTQASRNLTHQGQTISTSRVKNARALQACLNQPATDWKHLMGVLNTLDWTLEQDRKPFNSGLHSTLRQERKLVGTATRASMLLILMIITPPHPTQRAWT